MSEEPTSLSLTEEERLEVYDCIQMRLGILSRSRSLMGREETQQRIDSHVERLQALARKFEVKV